MKRNGATTVWERWSYGKHCSNAHPMFGACSRQIFQGILGINQIQKSFGYSSPVIEPHLPDKMNYAEGSFMTPKGKISVVLNRISSDTVKADISLPKGITGICRTNGIEESFLGEKSFFIMRAR